MQSRVTEGGTRDLGSQQADGADDRTVINVSGKSKRERRTVRP